MVVEGEAEPMPIGRRESGPPEAIWRAGRDGVRDDVGGRKAVVVDTRRVDRRSLILIFEFLILCNC